MPEVVYPTPDEQGNPRTWDNVFPIWSVEQTPDPEWKVINTILEQIAMNNRFGEATPAELKQRIAEEIRGNVNKFLNEVFDKYLIESLNIPDELPEVSPKEKFFKERASILRQYGTYTLYLDQVFDNLGGAYREYKS